MSPDPSLVGEWIDAAVQDQPKAARMLLEHPELKDARWRLGETCLHFCVVENFPEAVRFFAQHGVDVNATNQFGDPALVDAVSLGNDAMVALLIELGAEMPAR